MKYHWDWTIFFAETDDGLHYWQWIVSGLGWTIAVGLGALIIALLLGSALGMMRTTQSRLLVAIGDLYIDIFRNIPLIVQLFLWFFVLPELLPKGAGDFMKQKLPDWVIAIGGLGLFTAARISEQVKSGINTLSRGQRFAGLAVGLTEWQTYRYVRLPMAFRIIIPTLTSECMNVFKNSAVTYAVGMLELYFQYKQIIEKTSQVFEITIVTIVIYTTLAMTINRIMAFIERRSSVPGYITGGGK